MSQTILGLPGSAAGSQVVPSSRVEMRRAAEGGPQVILIESEEEKMSTQAARNRESMRQMPDTQTGQMPEATTTTRQMPGAAIRQMPEDGRRGNETKPSLMSTEFWIYLASVGGVLLASYLVGRDVNGVDVFRADRAWFLITLLTIGYLASRGLAKVASSWRRSGR